MTLETKLQQTYGGRPRLDGADLRRRVRARRLRRRRVVGGLAVTVLLAAGLVGWRVLSGDGERTIVAGPTSVERAAVDTRADLAGSRWVTAGADLRDRDFAEWIEFGEDGRFRMSVVCGIHAGTYLARGGSAALTVTNRDMGAACDPIAPPADAVRAVVEGERLRVDFVATADRNLPEDLTTTYVDVEALPTPDEADVVGGWTARHFLGGDVFYSFVQVEFDDDGTARLGSCPAPATWSIDGGRLALGAAGDECLAAFGVEDPTSVAVRLDDDRLHLVPDELGDVLVLTRAEDVLERPALVLREIFDAVGAEGQTVLDVDDPTQEAATELDWEGDIVTVRLSSLVVAEPVSTDLDEVVLGGRSVIGVGELAFDCGPDRFVVTSAERRRLLEIGSVLMDGLRCDPEPPG